VTQRATTTAGSSDPIERARGFQAELRARADEIEQARRLPADLSRRFAAAGFYALCAPEVYGGLEKPPATTAAAVETLARADASAAWCVFIGATTGSALALLPPAAAREIFASPDTLLCGVFAPRGRADAEPGGFRANGRWAWGSGTENADWILGGCRLFRNGEPWLGEKGAPRAHMLLAPAAEVTRLDTWHVSGLCGTGSTDFELRDVFVPEERAVGFLQPRPLERPLYAFPHFGLLGMGIAAVTLGIARSAIDELVALAAGKRPEGTSRTLAERPSTQSDVARAEALWRSARAFFYETLESAFAEACARGRIELAQRRDLRLATTHAVGACVEAVDLVYHLGGGTSVYRSSPLQRHFRDVHVASQHMMVGRGTLELTGRLLLGLDTDTAQL
jgi:alkylation response protein AidB-like acyl-CoA dehydrogenase